MTTYYEKRGRRYYPVAEHMTRDALPEGHYLVTVKPGVTSWTRDITPDTAALKAAQNIVIDELAKWIYEAGQARPTSTPLTPEQKTAWEACQAAHGGGPFYLTFPAAQDIAKKFLNRLEEKLSVPGV